MSDWSRLLPTARWGECDDSARESHRAPFKIDKDRIAFSAAFRRLSDKTQVHGRAGTDHVRTRLTHSIEVSLIGHSLGLKAAREMADFGFDAPDPHTLANVVESGGLAHDIGSVPFGHQGEKIISDWFRGAGAGFLAPVGSRPIARELQAFEGNARGFRVLTRLEGWYADGGLQLTAATLAAFQKYPNPVEPRELGPGEPWAKYGFLASEGAAHDWVFKRCDLKGRDGRCARHPLSYLTEAADDIAYCVADIEDAARMGCLSETEAAEMLASLGAPQKAPEGARPIAAMRSAATGNLIDEAAKAFASHSEEFLSDAPEKGVLARIPSADAVREALATSKERFYGLPLEERPVAYKSLTTVLDHLGAAFAERERLGRTHDLPSDCDHALHMFPDHRTVPLDREGWLAALGDFVGGMTDGYAKQTAERL